jgi:hypothetical protein
MFVVAIQSRQPFRKGAQKSGANQFVVGFSQYGAAAPAVFFKNKSTLPIYNRFHGLAQA